MHLSCINLPTSSSGYRHPFFNMRHYRHRVAATGSGQVQGPNSALTEFLKEQGITRRKESSEPEDGGEPQPEDLGQTTQTAIELSDNDSSGSSADEDDPDIIRIRNLARRKRNFDESEEDPDMTSEEEVKGVKNPGQSDTCAVCGVMFVVTAFSRNHKNDALKLLCYECTMEEVKREKEEKKRDHNLRKLRKKQAEALLDQKQYIRVPKLQDMCITLITTHIDDVEALGDIGGENKNKISRILSRNRRLDSETMKFFFDTQLKNLEFWDCSNIDSESLRMIGSFCPNLEDLTLGMCGRLRKEDLLYLGEKLTSLKSLYIDGAFLISGDTWNVFFDLVGGGLKQLTIKNSHRISSENIVYMSEKCSGLEKLVLSRLEGCTDSMGYEMIALTLGNLREIEISHPQDESLVSDDLISGLVSTCGPQLVSINFDGCSGLTDKAMGALRTCTALNYLSLSHVDQLTDNGVASLFYQWDNPGLSEINMRKCIALGDDSFRVIVENSGPTLKSLCINSWAEIGLETVETVCKKLPGLQEIDLGFCKGINNQCIELLVENCPLLEKIEVYGDPGVTEECAVGESVKLIGRMSDVA